MRLSNEWLLYRIKHDPDEAVDIEKTIDESVKNIQQAKVAGYSASNELVSAPKGRHSTLGVLLFQLRRKDKIEVDVLSSKLGVSGEEIQRIESDETYMPNPRTIHKIATYYKIPTNTLIRLTPAATHDPELDKAVSTLTVDQDMRYAACSGGLSSLSREERKRLNDFIKYLSKYKNAT